MGGMATVYYNLIRWVACWVPVSSATGRLNYLFCFIIFYFIFKSHMCHQDRLAYGQDSSEPFKAFKVWFSICIKRLLLCSAATGCNKYQTASLSLSRFDHSAQGLCLRELLAAMTRQWHMAAADTALELPEHSSEKQLWEEGTDLRECLWLRVSPSRLMRFYVQNSVLWLIKTAFVSQKSIGQPIWAPSVEC
jgi:hypothetical protein